MAFQAVDGRSADSVARDNHPGRYTQRRVFPSGEHESSLASALPLDTRVRFSGDHSMGHTDSPDLQLCAASLTRPELPRRIVRNLLFSNNLTVGSRVLDVGCGHGELVHRLRRLGVEADGFDESISAVELAEANVPIAKFFSEIDSLAEAEPYDCIIVRNFSAFDDSLLSHQALHASARFFSSLIPRGRLVFLTRLEPATYEFNSPTSHTLSCFAQHLTVFPGTCSIQDIPDSITARRSWRWIVGQVPRAGYLKAQIQIPSRQLTWEDWSRTAEEGVRAESESCCRWGLAFHESRTTRAA